MVEGVSSAAREVWNSGSESGRGEESEVRAMLSRDYTEMRRTVQENEPATHSLSREITEHRRQLEQQTYLDKALSFVSEPFHGSAASLARMEELQARANKGANSPEIEKEIKSAIARDQSALGIQSEINTYGSGMVQTAGLFLGGKKGLAYTAVAFAAGSAKPDDSTGTQIVDATLGASKGLVTRGLFQGIGRSALDIPTKALAMGGSARFSDALLNRHTFVDQKTGAVDVLGGLGSVAGRTLDPTYMATDLVVFGAGQTLMANSSVRSFVQNNALRATMASAGAFGVASGGADELKRQVTTGEQVDLSKVAVRALLRGGTDAVAAIPGGMQASRMAAIKHEAALDRAVEAEASVSLTRPREVARLIRENIDSVRPDMPGSNSREFQIVGGDRAGLDLLGRTRAASAVVDVREVGANGSLVGPTQKMLVQHLDSSTPLRSRLASTVDLIASCNPQSLCGPLRNRHLFPEASGPVFFTKLADRLKFGTAPDALASANGVPVELGSKTVSDLLRSHDTSRLRTPRYNLDVYAREMRHFRDPALRILDGGADSIVIELADGRILKLTDRPYRNEGAPLWRPEWGHRTIKTDHGTVQFDARLLSKPVQIDVGGEPVMYYIQERARTPVTTASLSRFHDRIDRDGSYVFWDGGASSLGHAQLGYVERPGGKTSLVLLDYDAVRKPHEVPPEALKSPGSDNHWMSRYRADRVEWDR